MTEKPRCPACDSEIRGRASPGGLCPRCLLKLGLPVSRTQETTATSTSEFALPDRVGPYRILQKLGEGGMGEVYQAEQERPIRRMVALKLIKAGMDTKQVVARFESERQALALMNHANIARVFEAGTTERGRPYFVMEFVQGLPITEYCDRQRSSTQERLELFLQVCRGVQHAHQKGIIHRDIKPSNVLVSLQDGKPVPKIIDFGVARATEQRLTEKSLFTQLGILVGTPEYMSPEQAEMTTLDIDTRTDVYSLGVLLYELLAGVLPFESSDLRRGAFDEICRRIREETPSKPSARISTGGDASVESAHRRRTDRSSLAHQLRGDLDWITMMALEKDRTRRYASPNELAEDVQRYLRHEPVNAGPPSAAYRAGKFVRRHRVGVAFAAVVVLLLAALAVAMTIQTARIARERDTAERVSEFLVELFEVSDPSEARGRTITAREVLDKSKERIERELADQPAVRGRLLHTMGTVYRNLGLYESSRPLLNEALASREELYGEEHPTTLTTLAALAWLSLKRGDYVEAENQYRRLLASRLRALGDDHPETLSARNGLGNVLRILERFDEAEALLVEALAAQRRTLGDDDERTATTMVNLAVLRVRQGRFDDARLLFLEALEVKRGLFGDDAPNTITTMSELAWLCIKQGRYEEARDWYGQALDHRRRILGDEHPDTLTTMVSLANTYRILGLHEEAESLFLTALEVQQRVLEPGDRDLARARVNLGTLYSSQERFDDAETQYRAALEIFLASVGEEHGDTLTLQALLAEVHFRQGRSAEAEATLRGVIDVRERIFGEDHSGTMEALHKLGWIYREQQRYREAEEILDRVARTRHRVLGEEHPRTLDSVSLLDDVRARRSGAEPAPTTEDRTPR